MEFNTESFQAFVSIGLSCPGAIQSQMFGKPCFKLNGKAFICFFEDEMVFKLPEPARGKALSLAGSRLFDPSGKNRPMKEWIQVPFNYLESWNEFANEASTYLLESK